MEKTYTNFIYCDGRNVDRVEYRVGTKLILSPWALANGSKRVLRELDPENHPFYTVSEVCEGADHNIRLAECEAWQWFLVGWFTAMKSEE